MAFTNFRLNVTLRVFAFAAATATALWGWAVAGWQVTPVVAGVLAVLSALELIRYVERTHRELTGFLRSVAHQDYSVPIPEQRKGRVFDELEGAYRLLSDEFKRLNLQKAANHEYLEAVVQHVGVALIGMDEAGRIVLVNEPALDLFGLPHLQGLGSLARVDERLPDVLHRLRDGDRELYSLRHGDNVLQLVLYATEFMLVGRRHKLVSLQNIRDELERREIESWQKLIRVLTHEIMNSVTPIISLSRLISETLAAEAQDSAASTTLSGETRTDLLRSVNAVHSRSSGLLEFVQAYRSFATVPAPVPEDVDVAQLLAQVRTVMSHALQERRIALLTDCEQRLPPIRVDGRQIEQVLINLVRNAMEALVDMPEPRITLRAIHGERGRVLIQVTDNGSGIDPAHLDNIFVPFFTTKRGGSGVGLSISRQLVHANRGFMSVRPADGQGSVFALTLPAVSRV